MLDELLVLKDTNFIKVVTGVRRAGKSTLLLQFQELLREKDSSASIISINMDLPEFRFLAEKYPSGTCLAGFYISPLQGSEASWEPAHRGVSPHAEVWCPFRAASRGARVVT